MITKRRYNRNYKKSHKYSKQRGGVKWGKLFVGSKKKLKISGPVAGTGKVIGKTGELNLKKIKGKYKTSDFKSTESTTTIGRSWGRKKRSAAHYNKKLQMRETNFNLKGKAGQKQDILDKRKEKYSKLLEKHQGDTKKFSKTQRKFDAKQGKLEADLEKYKTARKARFDKRNVKTTAKFDKAKARGNNVAAIKTRKAEIREAGKGKGMFGYSRKTSAQSRELKELDKLKKQAKKGKTSGVTDKIELEKKEIKEVKEVKKRGRKKKETEKETEKKTEKETLKEVKKRGRKKKE